MSYQALYRQWRPLDFDEVIGQNHITTPLKNQIQSETYGHAYIFSGTRGTGKTSTAKIFARAVNCLNNSDGNPCNVCENCKSILDEQFIDVVEMDAASNNSVDDIRELREHVKFAPSKGKYKVYIIDEVHMLSQGAFNALLKTLEEPPEYVIFLLATTEPQKIPATILSRCQRFDFKRISYDQILTRLMYICDKISVVYDIEALKLIIQKSDGAVRDSLSALDQCLSVSSGNLSIENVLDVLGVVEKTQVIELIRYLASSNVSDVLVAVDGILKQGKDLTQFLASIIEAYRDLLIVKMVKTNHDVLINASQEYIQSLQEMSEYISPAQITRSLELLIDLSKSLKYSQNKRIVFETTLVKLISPEVEKNYNALLERVERLEMALSSGKLEMRVEHPAKVQPKLPEKIVEESPIEDFIEFTDQEISLDEISSKWPVLLNTVAGEKKGLHPILMGSEPMELKGNRCLIGVASENKMFVTMLTNPSNSEYLNGLISRLLKKNITLDFSIRTNEEADNNQSESSEEAQIMDYFKDYKDVLEIK